MTWTLGMYLPEEYTVPSYVSLSSHATTWTSTTYILFIFLSILPQIRNRVPVLVLALVAKSSKGSRFVSPRYYRSAGAFILLVSASKRHAACCLASSDSLSPGTGQPESSRGGRMAAKAPVRASPTPLLPLPPTPPRLTLGPDGSRRVTGFGTRCCCCTKPARLAQYDKAVNAGLCLSCPLQLRNSPVCTHPRCLLLHNLYFHYRFRMAKQHLSGEIQQDNVAQDQIPFQVQERM